MPTKVRFLRYGKFRYQNQEHTVEVLVAGRRGRPTTRRRRSTSASTRPMSANTPTGSTRRSRWSASISSPRPRSASSTMRKREATGADAGERAQGPPRRRLCARGHPQRRDLRRRQARARHDASPARRSSRIRARPSSSIRATGRGRRLRQHPHRSGDHGMSDTATREVNDPITLEIIQNSLQATADEMFAVMKKTAMSSIIYEVLDMGTGITDADGALASSGAGIPAFIGVLDKAVKAIVEVQPARGHRAGRRLRHQRSLLRRRHASQRHRRRDAGLRRRRASSPGRPTSPTESTSAAWCRARSRPTRRDLPGGAAAARRSR